MGIDIRTDRRGKYDRCKYYEGKYIDHMKLVQDAVAQGVFYSTDFEPMTVETLVTGNVRKNQYRLTITTSDVVPIIPNDYVLYGGDDEIWIVEHVTPDDENSNKQFSKRPSNITKIRMRR